MNDEVIGNPGSHAGPLPQLDGVFVLKKPAGPTSAQCLKVFKRHGQKKVGHAGTLDPLASGVLIVLLGHATKIASWLQSGGRKVYSGWLRLGLETDTWDASGKVVGECGLEGVTPELAEEAVRAWMDMEEQEVPAFSAAKHMGQPLYKLARGGREVPKKIKKINVFEAGMLECRMPFVKFRVECASGSYVRSLAHSLGMRLGCGAVLESLTREYSHPYGLEMAVGLDELGANPGLLRERLLPIESALPEWERISLSARQAADARNGKSVPARGTFRSAMALLCHAGAPVALASAARGPDGPEWRIARGLWH